MRARIAASSGLFALNREISVCAGLRGGGRSHSRTCLQRQNSLLTGKITRNFADSGLNPQFWWRVSWRIQSLKAKFPAKRNRQFFRRIRELISKNRELQLPKSNFRYNRSAWILAPSRSWMMRVSAINRPPSLRARTEGLAWRRNASTLPKRRCLGAPAEMVPQRKNRKLRIGKPFRRIGRSAW
jgi:hypothetical protein